MPQNGNQRTAFVLAGGGSLGAVQVGMLKALTRQQVIPDFVVGASVGAINGVYFALEPNEAGVARLERIWLRIRRADIFPVSPVNGAQIVFATQPLTLSVSNGVSTGSAASTYTFEVATDAGALAVLPLTLSTRAGV